AAPNAGALRRSAADHPAADRARGYRSRSDRRDGVGNAAKSLQPIHSACLLLPPSLRRTAECRDTHTAGRASGVGSREQSELPVYRSREPDGRNQYQTWGAATVDQATVASSCTPMRARTTRLPTSSPSNRRPLKRMPSSFLDGSLFALLPTP